jgi:hypothetical protein
VNTKLLVDEVVRQTMILIAQVSTAADIRAPLAHAADQRFWISPRRSGTWNAAPPSTMATTPEQEPTMTLSSLRVWWFVTFCALAAFGCQSGQEDPGTDSNTNWLESCESNEQCDSPYSCLCGVCTLACGAVGDCAGTPEVSECRLPDERDGCPTALCLRVNAAEPSADDVAPPSATDDDVPEPDSADDVVLTPSDDDTSTADDDAASDDDAIDDDTPSLDDDADVDDDTSPVETMPESTVPVVTVPISPNCPPCIAPPAPGCIGEGPCGCGPYVCPEDGSAGAGGSTGGGGSGGTGNGGAGNGGAGSPARLPPECDLETAEDCQCLDDADCEPGTVCYYSDCAAALTGGCETPPAEGSCWDDRDCRDDQVCLYGAFPVCDSTTRESLGTCSVANCGDLGGPCGELEICLLIETGNLMIEQSWQCVGNPCLGEPLSCTCANSLCEAVGSACSSVGPVDGRDYTADVVCPSMANCTSPDTPIATPLGNRSIASLAPGDLVYTLDDTGVRAVPILEARSKPAFDHSVLRIRFANGAEWRVSANHPTADGRLLLDLEPGERVHDGTILSIEQIPFEFERTYDILPASPSGVYFADGVPLGSTLLRH